MVVGYGVFVAGELRAAFAKEEDAIRHAAELASQMLMIEGEACLNDGTPAEPELHPLCCLRLTDAEREAVAGIAEALRRLRVYPNQLGRTRRYHLRH